MKKKIRFQDNSLDKTIENFFDEAVGDLRMDTSFKKKLLAIPEEEKSLSPFSRFLEREICIPMFSIPAFAAILMILIGISAHSLLLPGDLPQPKYEIVEMSHDELNIYISNRY